MRPVARVRLLVAVLVAAGILPASVGAQVHDIPYATDHPDQVMDWYAPPGGGSDSPAIVYIHGGLGPSANPGDKSDVTSTILLQAFLDAGLTVFAANQRPYPDFLHPAQLEDVAATVRHLRANAAVYGIDPDRVMLWGISSGAILSGILAYGPEILDPGLPPAGQPSSRPQAWINTVGLTDMFLMVPTFPGAFLGVDTLGDATFQQLADASATWLIANVDRPFTPPVVSLYGDIIHPPPLTNPHDATLMYALHDALATEAPEIAARSLTVLDTGPGQGPWYQTVAAWATGEAGLGPAAHLGGGVAGAGGALPGLSVSGDASPGGAIVIGGQSTLTGVHVVTLVLGPGLLNAPFKGGRLVPVPTILLPLATDAGGALDLPAIVPATLPPGFTFALQLWLADAGAPAGWAGSDGLFVLVL